MTLWKVWTLFLLVPAVTAYFGLFPSLRKSSFGRIQHFRSPTKWSASFSAHLSSSVAASDSICSNIKEVNSDLNFGSVVARKSQWLVDNSEYVTKLFDTDSHVYFTRPPGFGKSSLLNLTQAYYDKSSNSRSLSSLAHVFDEQQTRHKNVSITEMHSYHVLRLDFELNSTTSTSFHDTVNEQIESFCGKCDIDSNTVIDVENAGKSLTRMVYSILQTDKLAKLMILIDNYDFIFNSRCAHKSDDKRSKQFRLVGLEMDFYEFLHFILQLSSRLHIECVWPALYLSFYLKAPKIPCRLWI